jgi:transcriptional regulator with XRE-family HTH domain
MTPAPAAPQPGRGSGARARLAHALREARRHAGLAGTEAGRRVGMSQSKISKIERGFLLPAVEDVAALCSVYAIPAGEADTLAALAAGLREEASAKVILARGAAEMQRRMGQLEASARVVRSFQPTMVIGLLQTAAYMRCVFGAPGTEALPEQEADDAAAARLARQRVLDDPSRQFVLVMSEGALRWQAGSASLMVEQVEAVAATAARSHVRIGLIPWTTPVRVFPRHGFHLYDEDAVVVGTETATATMTGAADVATYLELFAALEAAAAFGDGLLGHLARITGEYRHLATFVGPEGR